MPGVPELTELGKQIEMLRIQRGLSKQALAKHAGTSRQQLWRVMTGKSELTGPLRGRLADALHVQPFSVSDSPATQTVMMSALGAAPSFDLAQYLARPDAIERTLATMPSGDAGRAVKRRVLDALEECAMREGQALGAAFFDLRRRVVAGEL